MRDISSAGTNILLLFKGALVGVAIMIPGLSGGTMAVVTGIYEKVIGFMSDPLSGISDKDRSLFMARVVTGAVLSIIAVSQVMDVLLSRYYALTMFTFLGMVIGGIPVVARRHEDMRISFHRCLAFIAGSVVVGLLVILNRTVGISAGSTGPSDMSKWFLLFGGFSAGGAMIVPGISGSLVLLLLGQYAYMVASVKNMAFVPILLFSAGALLGIVFFSKAIKFFLRERPALTYYMVLGLIVASCFKMFPGMPRNWIEALFSSGLFFCGAAIPFFLARHA